MVVKGQAPPPSSEISLVYPKSISDFKQYESGCHILKFNTDSCPPCKMLHSWLESKEYKPKKNVNVICINLSSPEQTDIALYLRDKLTPFRGVPHLVVYNDGVEVDESTGFSKEKFMKMCDMCCGAN